MKAYLLTVKGNGRLIDGKLPFYPSVFPDYRVVYATTPANGVIIPNWFKRADKSKSASRSWCCYLSHLNLFREHLNKYPDDDLLALEDDVRFLPGFDICYKNFINRVPDDWGAIWFGGFHLDKPTEVVPGVLKCSNMANTECILINHKLLPTVVQLLESEHTKNPWQDRVVFSSSSVMPHYAPLRPFAWQQDKMYSDIQHRIVNHGHEFNFDYIDINGDTVKSSERSLLVYT